jgi:hypothetical protein
MVFGPDVPLTVNALLLYALQAELRLLEGPLGLKEPVVGGQLEIESLLSQICTRFSDLSAAIVNEK